jgi:uncharacterized repeat protein (TIGR01451 family)
MKTVSHSEIRPRRPLVLALHTVLATGLALPTLLVQGAETTLVSVDSFTGEEGNNWSFNPKISADGRFVAFDSGAFLVPGDNYTQDVFVHDRVTHLTTRVSVNSIGEGGNYGSVLPAISADGRFVAFQSYADNLVAGDTNGKVDVFVHDRGTHQTTRVSEDSAGAQGNGHSGGPSISADGRFVAFESLASNLVAGDTNGEVDVFVHDRVTRQTTRVSLSSTGTEGSNGYYGSRSPAISADGRFVAFQSDADNLVADDTNGVPDIFVRDRSTGQTTRVSVDSAGAQSNQYSYYPAISANGRYVAFVSSSHIFVHDRRTHQTTRVSVDSAGNPGNGPSYWAPSISADGRFVAFDSAADNLVAGDTNERPDVFVHDRGTHRTTRVSMDSAGAQSNGWSYNPAISADGRWVAFQSDASNLVAGDTNGKLDVFVRDRLLNQATRSADLKVTQTVSANPVTKGAIFHYTATVTNLGSGNAGNVVLTDLAPLHGKVSLPPTLTPSQGSCTKGPISICRLGTLNAGQQATVQVTFKALKAGTVANRVSVHANPQDPKPLNNAAVTSTTISSP